MGCAISGLGLVPKQMGNVKDEAPVVNVHLSEEHRETIKETWKSIQDDIAKVGIIIFMNQNVSGGHLVVCLKESDGPRLASGTSSRMLHFCTSAARLFETHPECKDTFFLFRDVEDLETLHASKELRAHGLRIMSLIEKSVARIHQMELLYQLILDLGKSHYHYNAPPKYYGCIGAEFVRAVQPILKDQWTPEVELAWKTLFLYITNIMEKGYMEEEDNQRNAMSNTSREAPERRLNVI